MDFNLFDHQMDAGYLVSQIFALIGTILSLYAYQKRRKIQLLNFSTLAAISSVFHYLFLGAWAGVATKAVGAARNAYAAYETHKHRTSKLAPIVFVAFYVAFGLVTYEHPASFLPVLAASLNTIAIYVSDARHIRYVGILTASLWLIYDIFFLSIVGIASEAIFIANTTIAIYRYSSFRTKHKNTPKKSRLRAKRK